MAYASGGYAHADVQTSFFAKGTTPYVGSFQSSSFQGWFVGGGFDHALTDNLLIGVDYKHIDLQTELQGPIPPAVGASRYISPTADLVEARITLKLSSEPREKPPLK